MQQKTYSRSIQCEEFKPLFKLFVKEVMVQPVKK